MQFFRDQGYHIRLGPCRECKKERRCPYRQLFRCPANQRAQVLLITSWHLRRSDFWQLKALDNRPLVVLDEDATTALAAPVELRDDRLRNFVEQLDTLRSHLEDDVVEIGALVNSLPGCVMERAGDELPVLIDLFRRVALDLLAACARTIGGTWVPAQDVLPQALTDDDRRLLADNMLMERLLRAAYEAANRRAALPNLFADLVEYHHEQVRLEGLGLLERHNLCGGRRTTHLKLTAEGERLARELLGADAAAEVGQINLDEIEFLPIQLPDENGKES